MKIILHIKSAHCNCKWSTHHIWVRFIIIQYFADGISHNYRLLISEVVKSSKVIQNIKHVHTNTRILAQLGKELFFLKFRRNYTHEPQFNFIYTTIKLRTFAISMTISTKATVFIPGQPMHKTFKRKITHWQGKRIPTSPVLRYEKWK